MALRIQEFVFIYNLNGRTKIGTKYYFERKKIFPDKVCLATALCHKVTVLRFKRRAQEGFYKATPGAAITAHTHTFISLCCPFLWFHLFHGPLDDCESY